MLLCQKSLLIYHNITGVFGQSDFYTMNDVVLLAALLVSAA